MELQEMLMKTMEAMNEEDRLSEKTKMSMVAYIMSLPGTGPEQDLTIAHNLYELVLTSVLHCYEEQCWENMIDDIVEVSKMNFKKSILKKE